jgi:hypothetical protein
MVNIVTTVLYRIIDAIGSDDNGDVGCWILFHCLTTLYQL